MFIGLLLFIVDGVMHVSDDVFDLSHIHIEMYLNRQGTVGHRNG